MNSFERIITKREREQKVFPEGEGRRKQRWKEENVAVRVSS